MTSCRGKKASKRKRGRRTLTMRGEDGLVIARIPLWTDHNMGMEVPPGVSYRRSGRRRWKPFEGLRREVSKHVPTNVCTGLSDVQPWLCGGANLNVMGGQRAGPLLLVPQHGRLRQSRPPGASPAQVISPHQGLGRLSVPPGTQIQKLTETVTSTCTY